MDNENLATELLHELKQNAKRWFIAFCIMVGLEIATIIGFMWYISLPTDDYSLEQKIDDTTNSHIRVIGGNNYGDLPEDYEDTESDKK